MKTFNIGELATKAGVASQAIRYYEQQKLMPDPGRTKSNYRRYSQDALARLRFILQAKEWGFTLDEIREFLILQDANGDRAEAKRIAEQKLSKIRQHIRDLSRVEEVLSKTLSECSGEGPIKGCPIVEAIGEEK